MLLEVALGLTVEVVELGDEALLVFLEDDFGLTVDEVLVEPGDDALLVVPAAGFGLTGRDATEDPGEGGGEGLARL